jgi:hypothetical protein
MEKFPILYRISKKRVNHRDIECPKNIGDGFENEDRMYRVAQKSLQYPAISACGKDSDLWSQYGKL